MADFYFNPSEARKYMSYLLGKVFDLNKFPKKLQATLEAELKKNGDGKVLKACPAIADALANVIVNDILMAEQQKLDTIEAEGIARRINKEVEVAYQY